MSNKKKNTPYQPPVKTEAKSKLQKKHLIAISVAAIAIIVTVAAVISVVLLSGHKFKFKNGEIVEANGKVYKPVLMNFRPLQYESKDPYGELDHPIFGKVDITRSSEREAHGFIVRRTRSFTEYRTFQFPRSPILLQPRHSFPP